MEIYVLVLASALFIYFDATKNKIGKVEGEKGFLNISAGMWALATLLLWIVAFPLYLINRGKLIAKAATHPQEVSSGKRRLVMGLLGACLGLVLTGMLTGCSNTDPVAAVKEGTLNYDASLTVGDAFDQYKFFSSTTWETLEDEQGRTIVEVRGTYDLHKFRGQRIGGYELTALQCIDAQDIVKGVDYVVQFTLRKNSERFDIAAAAYTIAVINQQTNEPASAEQPDGELAGLESIYADAPDAIVFGMLLAAGNR